MMTTTIATTPTGTTHTSTMTNKPQQQTPVPSSSSSSSSSVSSPPGIFLCAKTQNLMIDPVMSIYGHNYERDTIIQWFASGNTTCPMTDKLLTVDDIIGNRSLQFRIETWLEEHQQQEIETTDEEQEDDDDDDDDNLYLKKLGLFAQLPSVEQEQQERSSSLHEEVAETPFGGRSGRSATHRLKKLFVSWTRKRRTTRTTNVIEGMDKVQILAGQCSSTSLGLSDDGGGDE